LLSSSLPNNKVAVVTGSSSGIGYETSLILARNGFIPYATMRNLNKSDDLRLIVTKASFITVRVLAENVYFPMDNIQPWTG
jgi:NAD(P)-dependent dehydrogenase (short-subunit alcohol dehydrogenase family)